MPSKRTRLDRFIRVKIGINLRDVKPILARKRIRVNGIIAVDASQIIDQFSLVTLDDRVLQDNSPCYLMMNKPTGVVSATEDEKHTTVIDLLDRADRADLHIVGRLDFNSSGLILLTNDGRWSRLISEPDRNISKLYRVTVEKPLTEDYVEAFAAGMYFAYENITTRASRLKIVTSHVAEVSLVEGRYHQIKRMFGRFQNPVLKLHRIAIGNLSLDPTLAAGQSRELTRLEVSNNV